MVATMARSPLPVPPWVPGDPGVGFMGSDLPPSVSMWARGKLETFLRNCFALIKSFATNCIFVASQVARNYLWLAVHNEERDILAVVPCTAPE